MLQLLLSVLSEEIGPVINPPFFFLLAQVDFAMDVFKNLYPDQDVPDGLLFSIYFFATNVLVWL